MLESTFPCNLEENKNKKYHMSSPKTTSVDSDSRRICMTIVRNVCVCGGGGGDGPCSAYTT